MASNDKRILTKVAHMYYDESMTQQEIANKLGVSRPSVSRLLQRKIYWKKLLGCAKL